MYDHWTKEINRLKQKIKDVREDRRRVLFPGDLVQNKKGEIFEVIDFYGELYSADSFLQKVIVKNIDTGYSFNTSNDKYLNNFSILKKASNREFSNIDPGEGKKDPSMGIPSSLDWDC